MTRRVHAESDVPRKCGSPAPGADSHESLYPVHRRRGSWTLPVLSLPTL